MKKIVTDKKLIAYCGLYCGACRAYLKEKCKGCADNIKATWCGIRTCNIENKTLSCAECKKFQTANDCKKFNNFISKIFGFIFKSDRNACINKIKEIGYEKFAAEMAEKELHAIKKK